MKSLEIGTNLPKEQIDATLKEFVARFAERAAFHDQTGDIPVENLSDLRKAGLLSLSVPQSYGGCGIGLREMVEIVGRTAQGDPSTALILSMQYLQSSAVAKSPSWPKAVKADIMGSIIRDGALINALRVEPELGTPARGGMPATCVTFDGNVWRLNGRKIFSTGSSALHWGIVWAAIGDDTPRAGQVLVPLELPGVRIERSWNQLGMRATGSHTFIFDDVIIPERYISAPSNPDTVPEDAITIAIWHAVLISALYDGVARAARNWLIGFLKTRAPSNLGAPLSTLTRFHVLMGEIDALLLANQALLDHVSSTPQTGDHASAQAGLLKCQVTENAISAVGKAVAAIGNPGLSQDNPLERHYRDVLCGRIHTPQADSALAYAGKLALI